MKLNRLYGSLFAVLAAFATCPSATAADSLELQRELDHIEKKDSCPGLRLAMSCGNGVCEPENGENEETCPADCAGILIKSYNLQTLCRDVKGFYSPDSAEAVQSLVQEAVSKGHRIRVVGSMHSANPQLCTDGIIISTENLNRIIGLEGPERPGDSMAVVVEPGVKLGDLAEWLHKQGWSLGYAVTQFNGTTLGGAAATGSHGSSVKHSALVSSLIQSVTVITADGALQVYDQESPTLKAFRASLGSLGAIVKFKLRLRKEFNLDMRVSFHSERHLFENQDFLNATLRCDYPQLIWFPHRGGLMQICGKETTRKADPGAHLSFLDPGLPNFTRKPLRGALHYGACSKKVNCLIEDLRYLDLKLQPPMKKNGVLGFSRNTKHAIAPAYKMLTMPMSEQIEGLSDRDWEIAVPLSQLQPALGYIKRNLQLSQSCLPLSGISIRFVRSEDTTLIANSVAAGEFPEGEPAAFIETLLYYPQEFPADLAAEYLEPYENLQKNLIKEFGGRAHWGKNTLPIFEDQRWTAYGSNLSEFSEVRQELDPAGTFLNEFVERFATVNLTR